MPGQARVLGAERGEAGAGKPAPLVLRQRMGLFDPAESASAADSIVDGKDELAVQVRRAFTPAVPLGRDRVLPWGAQLRDDRPAMLLAESASADPLQRLAPGLASGHTPHLMGLSGQA